MDIITLMKKFDIYSSQKKELETTKDSKIAEIEEKVLSYRMELLEQVEEECKKYKEELTTEFDENYQKDLEKVSNYIELLQELINDAQLEDTTKGDEKVDENDRDDNSVL